MAATLIAGVTSCWAQTSGRPIRDTNANSWWVYQGDHRFGKTKWGTFVQVQVRRSNWGATWQQLQFLEGATYQVSPAVQVAAGYVWTRTARYGDVPNIKPLLEHRTYQQLLLTHSVKHLDLDHRYRLEQRFLETPDASANYYRYQNRVRYQLRASFPLSEADRLGRQWYVYGGNEVMLHFGPNHGPSTVDQIRPFLGLGYKVTKRNRIELGYLYQYLIQRNGRVEESNHTLRLQWSSTVGLFGAEN